MKSIIAAAAVLLLAAPQDPTALFASGDFPKAAAAAAATLAHAPDDPGALLVAGTLALYRNDLAAASADLASIPAGGPDASRIGRLIAEIHHRQTLAQHGDTTFGPDRDVTKFVETHPLPVVPAFVNGHRALFQIDTGAPGIALDRDFAKSLALPAAPAHRAIFADGKPVEIAEARVATLGLGGATIRGLSGDLLPLHEMMHGPNVIDGVIGMGVLERFSAFTLDYVRGELVTYAPSARVAVESETVVPFYLVGDHFLATRSAIAGIEGISLIDTGLIGGGIVPSTAVIESAHLALNDGGDAMLPSGMPSSQKVSSVMVPQVRIGAAVERDIAGVYAPGPTPSDMLGFASNGTISHGFFDRRAMTFDFKTMQLSISAHSPG